MPHALGEHGTFSGSAAERLSDLRAAFADPEVRAILCSRGGYGVVHIMKDVDALPTVAADPKWVIGFFGYFGASCSYVAQGYRKHTCFDGRAYT